jgi:hypothetical protein
MKLQRHLLFAAFCAACNPVHTIGTIVVSTTANVGPDGGSPDSGDPDGGRRDDEDGGTDDGGTPSCRSTSDCGCGQICSAPVQSGAAQCVQLDDCGSNADCGDDLGGGWSCEALIGATCHSVCLRVVDGGSPACHSDADCPCGQLCGAAPGADAGCAPIGPPCTGDTSCGGEAKCKLFVRDGGACGGAFCVSVDD